jgi:hypothetical protein
MINYISKAGTHICPYIIYDILSFPGGEDWD